MQWGLLISPLGSPWGNMATDEYLLSVAEERGMPVLRCYGWDREAMSFGYFQSYEEIASLTSVRPLVRRPTGGGLVSHVSDWTYSVAIPTSCEWYRLKACESYCRMHTWVNAAFRSMGLETSLAEEAIVSGPGQCFIGAEKHDVLYKGFKVAGAAQRRTKKGLLIQGSVQIPGISQEQGRPDWQQALKQSGVEKYGIEWATVHLTENDRQHIDQLASERYQAESFIRRR
jgi:lipoate-protein ligase A